MSIIKSQKEITKRNDILSAQFKIDSIHCLNFVKLFIVNGYTEYHIAQIVRLPVNKFKKIHNIYSKIFCLTLYNKCIWNGACMVSIKNSAVIRVWKQIDSYGVQKFVIYGTNTFTNEDCYYIFLHLKSQIHESNFLTEVSLPFGHNGHKYS